MRELRDKGVSKPHKDRRKRCKYTKSVNVPYFSEVPPGELRKYNGEPIETILIKTNVNPTRQKLKGGGRKPKTEEPLPPKGPAASKG